MDTSFLIIIFTLLFSAFFSAMEIAFISSNRLKVELDRSTGTFVGRILGNFYKNESRFIAMLLLGNNFVLVLFGIYAALLLNPVITSWGVSSAGLLLFLQTIISTILVLILAEFIPKALVQLNPNWFLRITALPMQLIYWLLLLPTIIVMMLSNVFLRLLNSEDDTEEKVFSKVDLEHYVSDINDRLHHEEDFGNEMQILQNALDFSNVKARDCMIPRTEIIALNVEESIDVLHKLFVQTGLSKIIIYRDSIDNIIGYVHSFEMFKMPENIKQILMPISFIPESIPGKEILEIFTKQAGNIAVVCDEYGGTSGLLTIEDVIEEIFGEIEDEHDTEDWIEEQIDDKEWRFSARADIDYLNDNYNVGIPDSDEYETLGGLIIHHLESIPEVGAVLILEHHEFIIEEVSDRRIEIVRIAKK
ncbi:hemolysin family protein [Crocinitomicaceae bacterium]|nr:hemolysin family protein [Crocinitomicaceae bacterium]